MRRLADERGSGRIKHNRCVIDNCQSLYTGSMFQPHLIDAAVAYCLQRTDETNCPGDALLRLQVRRCGLTNHWHPAFNRSEDRGVGQEGVSRGRPEGWAQNKKK